ncbi:hypothetical protein SLE2022_372110 [Rubroshorea leprosula]
MDSLSPEPPPVALATIPPPPTPPPPDILALLPPPVEPMPPTFPSALVSPNERLPLGAKSFKDTLVEGSASVTPPLVTYEELVEANKAFDSSSPMLEDGSNPTQVKVPKVRIPKEIWQRLCAPWTNAVIIKLLGKSINYHVLHARLLKEWRTENEFEVIDVGLGYYIVKLSSPQDYSKVLTGGPYKMFDHYLAVQPWEPGFHPARAKAPKTAVWIKLFGVPILCYYEAICMYLASKIGKPIKVDPTTLLATRGQFARVCVEVDLSQPLPSSVDLDLEDLPQSLILVEYEGLHKICFHCGEFGHKMEYCRFKNPEKSPPMGNPNAKAMVELSQALKPDSADNNMVYGPWMVQQRKQRRRPPQHRQSEPQSKDAPTSQPLITKNSTLPYSIQAQPMVFDRHTKSAIPPKPTVNRFEAIADIMDEDLNLQASKKGKEVDVARYSPHEKALTGSISPMNIILSSSSITHENAQAQAHAGQHGPVASIPPLAPSTSFIKPKPKHVKKNTKPLGLVSKVTKNPHPKPYDPPPVVKKSIDIIESKLPSSQPPRHPPPKSCSSPVNLPVSMAHSSSPQLPLPSLGSSGMGPLATATCSTESPLAISEPSLIMAISSPPTAVMNIPAVKIEKSSS